MSPAFVAITGLLLLALAAALFVVEQTWPGKLRELVSKFFRRDAP